MRFKKRLTWISLPLVLALLLVVLVPVSSIYASSPAITLSPDSGKAGSPLLSAGLISVKTTIYYVFFDKDYLAKGTVNSSGKFSKTITIPSSADPGNSKIVVKAGEDSHSSPQYSEDYDESDSATFVVLEEDPCVQLDACRVEAGDSVTLNGSHFDEDYYYYVFLNQELLGKGAVDSDGEFTETVTVPDDTGAGGYTFKVLTKDYSDSNAEYSDGDWQSQSCSVRFEVVDSSNLAPVDSGAGPLPPQLPPQMQGNQISQPGEVQNNGNGNGQGFFNRAAAFGSQGFSWLKDHLPW